MRCTDNGAEGVGCVVLPAAGAGERVFSFCALSFFAALLLLVRACLGLVVACSPLLALSAEVVAIWGTSFSFFGVAVLLRVEAACVFLGTTGVPPSVPLVSAVALAVARGRVGLFFVSVLRVRFVVRSFAGAFGSDGCDCLSFSTDAIVSITHT